MVGIVRILNHHNLGWWIAGPIVLPGDMSQQFWSIICVEYSAACYMHLYQYSQCTQDLVIGPQVSANLGHPWIHCKISEISSSYIFANNSLDNPCISDNRTVLDENDDDINSLYSTVSSKLGIKTHAWMFLMFYPSRNKKQKNDNSKLEINGILFPWLLVTNSHNIVTQCRHQICLSQLFLSQLQCLSYLVIFCPPDVRKRLSNN